MPVERNPRPAGRAVIRVRTSSRIGRPPYGHTERADPNGRSGAAPREDRSSDRAAQARTEPLLAAHLAATITTDMDPGRSPPERTHAPRPRATAPRVAVEKPAPLDARLESAPLRQPVAIPGLGVLMEDDARRVSLANEAFCGMFRIPLSPAELVGTDSAEAARHSAKLVHEPEAFFARIEEVIASRVAGARDEVVLHDGRILEREYVPVAVDSVARAHLWVYRDVTRQREDTEMVRASSVRDEFRRAVDTIPGLVWSARPDGYIDYFNRRWCEYTGLTLEQACGHGWEVAILPVDLPRVRAHWRSVLSAGQPGETEARLRRFDGTYRWFLFRAVPFYGEHGIPVKWYGQSADIDERKRAESLLAGEKGLLEMLARGCSLPDVLARLCQLVEENASGCRCSIVLVDRTGTKLQHGAAPSIPASYNNSIHGRPVNRWSGPCAMAAYLKTQVIAADIASDTRWDAYEWRALASEHGMRSCWSTPILSAQDEALGTFAIYQDEPANPTSQQQELIEQFTHLASVVIERKRSEDALQHLFADVQRENRERQKAEQTLEQRLAFERLISDLSADIAQTAVQDMDDRIKMWLARISESLSIERATFFEYSEETASFRLSACWFAPDTPQPPTAVDAASVPAAVECMHRNVPFRYERVDEMPASDAWIFERAGIRSALGLPVTLGGTGLGYLVLGALREERPWPDDLVQRLRVVAEMFANGLARKHAARDKRLQRELAEALDFRELVLGILGHDLRSPLSAASGLTQLMLQMEDLPPAALRRVRTVDGSINRMNDLIVTLLDFTESRFKGTLTIAPTMTDLEFVCARVVEEELASSPERSIQLQSEGPVIGNWDPVRVEQVVSNLLSNALKYGDSARPVVVRVSAGPEHVALEVKNAGAPIPPEALAGLFEPFRRGPTSESGDRRGLGLGLYIVRQIALAHGGSVAVDSSADLGTVFTVQLPRRAGSAPPQPAPRS